MSRRWSSVLFGVALVACAALLYWSLRYLPEIIAGDQGSMTDEQYQTSISSARTAAVQSAAALLVLGTGLAAWATALANRRSSAATEEKGWSEGFERAAKLLSSDHERERIAGAHLLGAVGVASPAMRPACERVLLESLREALSLPDDLPAPEEVLGTAPLANRLPHAAAGLHEVLRVSAQVDDGVRATPLRTLDLRATDLRSIRVRRCDFSGSLLDGALASGSRFTRCDFSRTRFAGAVARQARFFVTDFSRATMRGLNLEGAWFVRCDLRSADLRRVDLRRSRAVLCDFRGADLDKGQLRWSQKLLNRF